MPLNSQKYSNANRPWKKRLSDCLAITSACVFVLLAAYRIKLPGLYFDELIFADAAQGNPDTAWIQMKLGSLPIFIIGYLGALKAWIYAPIFRLLGASAVTVRLPVILLAAVIASALPAARAATVDAAQALRSE